MGWIALVIVAVFGQGVVAVLTLAPHIAFAAAIILFLTGSPTRLWLRAGMACGVIAAVLAGAAIMSAAASGAAQGAAVRPGEVISVNRKGRT